MAPTKVMERVFEKEEENDLGNQFLPRREGHLPCRQAEQLGNGMEEPNLMVEI